MASLLLLLAHGQHAVGDEEPKIMAVVEPEATPTASTASNAPTTIPDEMALVAAINGVYKAGVTFHTP